jgi:predicted Zn-dependent peptidase
MKLKNAIRLLTLATFSPILFSLTSAQSLRLPPHEKVVFKNGLTILLMEKHGVPMVSFSAVVKTGSAADPAGQEGLASATAELLRKGTRNRTAQQFATDLDFVGGTFDAGAGPDFTTISSDFLTKDLARGLDLFADAVLRPTFPQGETDKLLAQDIDGVKAAKDDPESVLFSYYDAYLLSAHPYGRPGSGDELSLKNIKREAIVKFYETYYAPGNMILAVAGEFNAAEMRKQLEAVLGTWPSKTVPALSIPVAVPAKGKRLLLIDKPDATQTYFAIGNVGIAANDPDRVAIRVVDTLFGGRFTSMLNQALRVESGLSYGAGSFFDSRKTPGSFAIYSFTKNESTAQALDLAVQTLEKLHKEGVTPEQLKSAKSYLKGQFPPTIETSGQLARRIAANEFYGLDDNEVNQLEARIDAVTPEISRQVIQKHFPKENLVFVLIGKASAIAPVVQKYAEKQDARAISEPGFWPPPSTKSSLK